MIRHVRCRRGRGQLVVPKSPSLGNKKEGEIFHLYGLLLGRLALGRCRVVTGGSESLALAPRRRLRFKAVAQVFIDLQISLAVVGTAGVATYIFEGIELGSPVLLKRRLLGEALEELIVPLGSLFCGGAGAPLVAG
jgi:hypothetical protein